MPASGAPAGACIKSQLMGFLDMVVSSRMPWTDQTRSEQQGNRAAETGQYMYRKDRMKATYRT